MFNDALFVIERSGVRFQTKALDWKFLLIIYKSVSPSTTFCAYYQDDYHPSLPRGEAVHMESKTALGISLKI